MLDICQKARLNKPGCEILEAGWHYLGLQSVARVTQLRCRGSTRVHQLWPD